ncbi:hypothetical protein G1C96_0114 [Bifidobacterium sp. DSM 109958]|uniref:Glycosyltransferase 2-like domain-containing protein n=1 Tax=Bifidobacterium moraviense TaxID=2675323 RepID=A0A7Y0F027_9BIFI|nr:glycosyltransferase family 2 protein [Bifidobacterium sp. DSM 109958]NMM99537.1 hypothetical protein [Bifidobacterium sp. DSM 109958]
MTLETIADTDVRRELTAVLSGGLGRRGQDVDASVVAVVTVEEDLRFFGETMAAVFRQRVLPGTVVVADCTGGTERPLRSFVEAEGIRRSRSGDAASRVQVQIVPVKGAASFGDAVSRAIAQSALPEAAESLWLLHDDSRPASDGCLETLVEAHRNVPTASVIGVKQLDWDGSVLHDVGGYAASGHRVVSLVVDGEPDQEQYDGRQDVFCVSLAGALVPLEVWRTMGGTTPWMTTFGESRDFCRRACLGGGRVLVVPRAAVAHRRARLEGLRTRAGAPVQEDAAGNAYLARITAAWRYRITDTAFAAWPAQWLALLVHGLVMFFVLLFRKRPYEGACELAMPWRALVNLPRAAKARIRVGRQSSTTLGRLGALTANHTQIARWKERRRAFASQRSVVLLSPLAKAHLRTRRRIRFAWAAAMAVVMTACAWTSMGGTLPALLSGAQLASGRLVPTGASLGQLWHAATTSYGYGAGLGAAAPPSPFLLVLGVASVVTLGHVQAAVTMIYLAAAPAAALSFWALAGIFTRSNPVRVAGGLMWGTLAMAVGLYRSADVPMLVVMVFLPAAFAFTHRAVAMYLTEDPVRPVPSVQSAALAALCFIPVVDAEPQLILPLAVTFLAFFVMVRRHRLMLLLIPLPAAFTLAPTLSAAVRRFGSGSWRQLFADALVPSSAATGSPRAMSLTDVVLAAFGRDAGAGGLSGLLHVEAVSALAMAVCVGLVVAVAVVALLMPMTLRVSRMMWTAGACGFLLAVLSPRVAVGVDVDGRVAGSVLPGFALAMMAMLACVCMVGGAAVRRFRPLAGPGAATASAGRWASMGRSVLTVAMAVCAVAWGCFGLLRMADASSSDVRTTRAGLPMVAVDYLDQDPSHRVVAVSARSSAVVEFTVMRTARGELVDVSPASGVVAASGTQDEETERIGAALGRLLSNGDSSAIQDLSDLGLGGIYVVADGEAMQADSPYDAIVANITASEGTQSVVSARTGTYFRITLRDVASQGIDMTGERSASASTWRGTWIWSLGVVVGLYCLVAVPGTRGRERA